LHWDDYVLERQIGAGASGKVYRARHKHTQQSFAVKFLKKSFLDDPRTVERFLREAKTVAELSHPGIVPVQGVGRTPGGGWFLVMELVSGENLAVGARNSIAADLAARYVASAATIVQSAHERGIVHCDLKPGNLLLDASGAVRVTDFGLAVRLADDAPAALLAGTPAFMAPEQVDPCWGPISARTDVWGLGATLYFLLYGRAPHQGRSVADTLAKVVSGRPVRFPKHSSALARETVEVCRKCLAKRPAERFATAADVASALESRSAQVSDLAEPD
jgi:serine/threonine protein kinase